MLKNILGAVILMMVMVSGANAGVIPNDLQWPLKNKGVADTSIFFNVEDAVDTPDGKARTCNIHGNRSGSTNFDRHAGHDIIASYNTPVYPIYDGYIVRIGSGGGWENYIVVEHNNNGKKWTSVYWHLQNKGLVKTKKSSCHSNINSNTKSECKVSKNTILGYIGQTTDMNDVNHLHLGIRPLSYDQYSVRGFGTGRDLHSFVNPLSYLPNKGYWLFDESKFRFHKNTWKHSNKLDMYSGMGYKETSGILNDSLAMPLYEATINSTSRYKIYVKFPVSSERSKKAIYALRVNGKWIKYNNSNVKIVDQSKASNRGNNIELFDYSFKKGDKITILCFNYDKNKYMSSDALLFVKQ